MYLENLWRTQKRGALLVPFLEPQRRKKGAMFKWFFWSPQAFLNTFNELKTDMSNVRINDK